MICSPKRRVAYSLLWFPLSSETFIFREVEALKAQGLHVHVFCMYGNARKGLSRAMRGYDGQVTRFGSTAVFSLLRSFGRALWRKPHATFSLMRKGLLRRMRNLEAYAENFWCFMAGFRLAEECRANGIELIHSAWANGPATAAWVASAVSGIPFAFSGRAGDIYPPDGILAEKAADAAFIRVNNAANVEWLTSFCPPQQKDKVRLIYNGLTFNPGLPPVRQLPAAPWRVLAVGRFARTKGFPYLLTAMARLRRENFPVFLTLIGDGSWRRRLEAQTRRLGLEGCVTMPGFVPNDELVRHMRDHHLLAVPSVVHANGDRDGIPNVIMEACSQELPVVATDVCGISEVIRTGETGILIRQRDAAALATAIRQQLEQPEEAARMARAARMLVLRMFDTEKNAQTLTSLYISAMPPVHA